MSEVILKIEQVIDYKIDGSEYSCTYDGFTIKTNKQEILLLIDNDQQCCENWGYFISNDNVSDFIGQELTSIEIVDTCLNTEECPKIYEGDIMFVNINTNKDTLQFTVYNDHNGYYGHTARIISNQLTEGVVL